MSLIVFIIILAILVLVHELGHFLAAKKNGILVEEFGFGYPPRIFSFKIKETVYSLNLIPLGGFVKVYGEEQHEKVNSKLKKRSFVSKKPYQKALVLLAGVIGNFLLGWVIISYLFTQGVPTPTKKVIVEQVIKNSPAEKAGIKPNDVIIRLLTTDNQVYLIKSTDDLISLTKKNLDKPIILEIDHQGQTIKKTLVPRSKVPSGQGPLGLVITSFINKKYPWFQAPFYGLIEAFNITSRIVVELLKTIFLFFSFKKLTVEVAGPIGIAYFTSKVIKFGNNAVLELTALLSLNLAVIQLLPFPALDGGRLAFVVYEWVTKKKVNKNFEKYLNLIGFILLLTLAAVISINDVIRLTK